MLLDVSDYARTGISKLITRCAPCWTLSPHLKSNLVNQRWAKGNNQYYWHFISTDILSLLMSYHVLNPAYIFSSQGKCIYLSMGEGKKIISALRIEGIILSVWLMVWVWVWAENWEDAIKVRPFSRWLEIDFSVLRYPGFSPINDLSLMFHEIRQLYLLRQIQEMQSNVWQTNFGGEFILRAY